MNFDIDKAIDGYEEAMIRDIRRLVKHYSVESEPLEGMPFGKGAADALNEAVAISNDLGFKTKNYDNYAATAEIGEGERLIGIVGHVDVVPVGDGWKYDPFAAEVHDGCIYGRGAIDDKGPSVAGLYAMKIVQDMGVPLNKRIRFLFGANEETGMRGVKYYQEQETEGFDYGFTPDAEFPVIFGEKGTFHAYFSGDLNDGGAKVRILSLDGGYALNVVCDKVSMELEANEHTESVKEAFKKYAEDHKLACKVENNKLTLLGVAAHASTPQLGVNAISHMMMFLSSTEYISSPFARGYAKAIGLSYLGENCGLALEDEYGKLTFNVGMINAKDGVVSSTIDVRYPLTITVDGFKAYAAKMVDFFTLYGLAVDGIEIGPSLYNDPDSPLVKGLHQAYVDATGDTENMPFTIGGGTYAKCFKNIVAFGPEFIGANYNVHMTDENFPIDHLKKAVKAYTYAILNLLAIED